jgi:hypothetical protein
MSKRLLIALAFLAIAIILRYWIAPLAELLPANYHNDIKLAVTDQFRESPTGKWYLSTLTAYRVDQVITCTRKTCILEGGLHVYFESGSVNFESTALYGVDRVTRENQSGYGTIDRSGQYFFPPHVQQKNYHLWDPMFIGLRQAAFDHGESFNGMQVYIFSFSATGMDETAGYSSLPDVPELYHTLSDGMGTIWIEPLSGIVVNYQDNGTSYFVNANNGTRLVNGEFHLWSNSYTPETITTQFSQARTSRFRILLLEFWLPGTFVLVGSMIVGSILFRRKKKKYPIRETGLPHRLPAKE